MIFIVPNLASNIGYKINTEDYYVRQVADGYDELIFEVSIWDQYANQIVEETLIKESSVDVPGASLYLVKSIDRGKNTMTVKCSLYLDQWKSTMLESYTPEGETVTPEDIVSDILPERWFIQSGAPTFTPVPADMASFEYVTPLDVLDKIRELFPGLTYRFLLGRSGGIVGGSIEIIKMDATTEVSAVLCKDYNLRATYYKGKSSSMVTRLYVTGKDGMTFADINDGKPYVEDNSYKGATICGYWKASEYSDADTLLAAAQARLAEMAWPTRSFDCDVVDLQAVTHSTTGTPYDLPLFGVVKIADETIPSRYSNIVNRIVEKWIHPDHPERNRIILSTAPARIQSQVQQLLKKVNQ